MVRHLLVTNDFPPKVGGIQNFLWELWRRLPSDEFMVYTTPHRDAKVFDEAQAFPVVRSREPWLLPHPWQVRRINKMAQEFGAELVILDPAMPLGLVGPHLDLPYGVVVHGAEIAIPARIPGIRAVLNRVFNNSSGVIAGSDYVGQQASRSTKRLLKVFTMPPGVDVDHFQPLADNEKRLVRSSLGLPKNGPLVVSVSRLVPRKGMDALIKASVEVRKTHRDFSVAIAGDGRDKKRLMKLIDKLSAPVQLLGRQSQENLKQLYGCGDVFAMLCRNRWGGLEQEGFGIVFLEAAASGVAQIAGRSGGAHEAVAHNETGLIVDNPKDPNEVASAILQLLDDDKLRKNMSQASRKRAEQEFSYVLVAQHLQNALDSMAPRAGEG